MRFRPWRGVVAALTIIPWLAAVARSGQSPARSPAPGVVLNDSARAEGLPLLIATNQLGLGAEAQKLVAWVLVHRGPLTLGAADLSIKDAAGSSFALSPAMTRTLGRINQWYGLAATKENPITHAQLEAGVIAPASIERIRDLFEAAIRRGVRIGDQWLTPETGGEATLDTELRFVEARDPRWTIVREMVKVSADPAALAAFCEQRAMDAAQVDSHGLLKNAIGRLRLGMAGAREELNRALLTVARNAAPTYSMGPEEQLTLITGADWEGRYVGGWHTHAPHDAKGEWEGGDVPSFEDMQNAIRYGQYLTLSFQPDGFDLYDGEALGDAKRVDLKLLKVIRYRSPSWREHFRKVRPGLVPSAHAVIPSTPMRKSPPTHERPG